VRQKQCSSLLVGVMKICDLMWWLCAACLENCRFLTVHHYLCQTHELQCWSKHQNGVADRTHFYFPWSLVALCGLSWGQMCFVLVDNSLCPAPPCLQSDVLV